MKKMFSVLTAGILSAACLSACASAGSAVPSEDSEVVTYNGNRYMISVARTGWYEAEEYCESLGGHLVTINSQEENDFLTETFTRPVSEAVMIGAWDSDAEGAWRWVTGETFSYSNWRAGEPNNENDEDYALLLDDGSWNDGHLDREEWLYVCEWEGEDAYILTYKGKDYVSAEYHDQEDNGKWKTEYDLTVKTGEFDWGQALISFVEGGYSDVDAYAGARNEDKEKSSKYAPSTPHGKVTSSIADQELKDTGLDRVNVIMGGIQMVAGFFLGGQSGFQNYHILLQTDGTDRRFLMLYGTPIEAAYAGKKETLAGILTNAHAGRAAYFLWAAKDADQMIRDSFTGLEEGGRYSMDLKFASYKDMKDCYFGYSVFINQDEEVFESPIIHKNTVMDVYYKPEGEKKGQLVFHAAPMADSQRYRLDDETSALLIDYLEGLE